MRRRGADVDPDALELDPLTSPDRVGFVGRRLGFAFVIPVLVGVRKIVHQGGKLPLDYTKFKY